ncbi:MAG TPA: glycosyltransferase family 39 protein [Burkholderiales bacterium]|nr:glycosyltransferase family 39 protein [Burkholderiales bacterium]
MTFAAAGAPSAATLKRVFWAAIGVTAAFRLWLAWWLPMTGDEAYFLQWGEAPALGYYDHPPMVGWLSAALLQLSHAKLVLRLPAVVLPASIAIGMAWLVRGLARGGQGPGSEGDAERLGYAAALAWLLVPAQVLNVAITTDTPLAFFSFLSLAAFALGVHRESPALFVAAGAALGLAFLSKYFAVMLGLGVLVFTVLVPRPGRWRDLAIVLAAAAPFVLLNAAWNYAHCWANLLHNVYNRDTSGGWHKPLVFAALLVYVSSPLLLWQLARGARSVRQAAARAPIAAIAACAVAPLALLAAASPFKTIGLHWLLAFMPALFMTGAFALGAARIAASARFLAGFSALHVVLVAAFAAAPVETWQWVRKYDSLVEALHADELLAALKPYEGKFAFASTSFSSAATLSYGAAELGFVAQPGTADGPRGAWRRHYFFVLGPASGHGRHDDIATDFRRLDGQDILVVRKTPADPQEYAPLFRAVEFRDVTVRGATFHLVLGQGFSFPAYRDRVLAFVRDRYYRIPGVLPQGRCYLCERYFGAATCPAR